MLAKGGARAAGAGVSGAATASRDVNAFQRALSANILKEARAAKIDVTDVKALQAWAKANPDLARRVTTNAARDVLGKRAASALNKNVFNSIVRSKPKRK